jgi:hypothetical protein
MSEIADSVRIAASSNGVVLCDAPDRHVGRDALDPMRRAQC